MNAGFGSLAPAGLAAAKPEQQMWWWQGSSSRWYVHTVFPLSRSTFVHGANYVMVRREWDGRRTALYIGQSENLAERLPAHHKLEAALRAGGNEIHVHLLAKSDDERFQIETDLRNGHQTVLNEQSSLAGLISAAPIAPFGFAGLGHYFK